MAVVPLVMMGAGRMTKSPSTSIIRQIDFPLFSSVEKEFSSKGQQFLLSKIKYLEQIDPQNRVRKKNHGMFLRLEFIF